MPKVKIEEFGGESLMVSREATAQLLGDIDIRSVDYLIKAGKLSSRKIGKRRMILRSSIVSFCKRDHERIRPAVG